MRHSPFKRALWPMALVGALSACGTNPYSLPKVETAEPSYEDPAPAPVPPARDVDTGGDSAHGVLVARASEASGRGDYDQALAYLERAQRIDPDNAEIYLALARTHDAAGNASQARAVAERGLLYCSGSRQCDALKVYAP